MKTRHLLLRATACLLIAPSADAIPIYWDGLSGGWDNAANWSTDAAATTPDPAAPPGASDVATFNITGANTAQTVSLNAAQSAQGISVVSTGSVTLQGGGTARTLSIGSAGITMNAGTTSLAIGDSAVAGQAVNVLLTADQSWLHNGGNLGGNGIFVRNSVGVSDNSTRTLTLGGTSGSTAISTISGVISDGSAGGKLNIRLGDGTAATSSSNRWNLNGDNTYTGVTTINAGGLGINHVNALGATGASSGTVVNNGGALFIRSNIGTIAAESLSLTGTGNGGALRNVSGTNTWTGAITANTGSNVSIGSDTGHTLTLSSTADVTTTSSAAALVFTATGSSGFSTINVNGDISGAGNVIKGGSVASSIVTMGGDAKTYTGATEARIGFFGVNTALSGTSSVAVGTFTTAATLRGDGGSINTAATTTIGANGTLAPGLTSSTIGTLSMGNLTTTGTATLAIDINSTTSAKDLISITGNLALDATNATLLSVSDLGATALAQGTTLDFIKYTGAVTGGLLKVDGTVIFDESTSFTVGLNTFQLNYDRISGTDKFVSLVVVIPEPGIASLAVSGVLFGLFRRRRK